MFRARRNRLRYAHAGLQRNCEVAGIIGFNPVHLLGREHHIHALRQAAYMLLCAVPEWEDRPALLSRDAQHSSDLLGALRLKDNLRRE